VLKLISSRTDVRYQTGDLDVAMGLADRAALAIDNARAYQDAADRAERLRHEAEWRERFMAMLSHDLRTPLSAVSLSAETMLRDPQLSPRSEAAAKRIFRATQRVTRMITDLLDVARARTGGGIVVHPREMDLRRVCEQVVEEVSKAFPDRRIEIASTPTCIGVWDEDRIAQVVDNLLTNAVRYSPRDSVVRIEIGETGDGEVFLRVSNAAQPIPAEVAAVLFEPFKRGARTAGAGGGLGLGLYIASEIAKAHGGTLVLEASDEAGTRFCMTLPRVARVSRVGIDR
jgi:signal transduction histidine kinase